MNCTNHNTAQIENQNEISPLKARLNRMAIHVPGDHPTPAEVIPIIERRLAAHMKHISRTASSTSGDYVEWKQIHDAYTEFLTDLREEEGRARACPARASARAASASMPSEEFTDNCAQPTLKHQSYQTHQNNFSPKNSPQNEFTVATQQSSPVAKVSSGELQASYGEFPVSSAALQLTSSEFHSPKSSPPFATTGSMDMVPSNCSASSDSDVDMPKYLDTAAQAAMDLQQYLSGRSPLDDLTPPQQEAILLLLNDYPAWRVAQLIAEPHPRGFDIQTTDASILRFRARLRNAKSKAVAAQDQEALAALVAEAQESESAFQSVIQRLIKDRLVRAATSPHAALSNIDAMITSLTKLRKQTLAERKQSHAETKK